MSAPVSATDQAILLVRLREITEVLSSRIDAGAGVHHRNPAYPDLLPALIHQAEMTVADLSRWLRDARAVAP